MEPCYIHLYDLILHSFMQKKIKGECKMVFVVRKDLKATKRDIAKYVSKKSIPL